MGKANKKLASALHQEHEALSKKYNPDITANDNDLIKIKPTYDDLISELSVEIEQNLINYSVNNAVPLCEYLDHDNMKNFVQWLISRQI